MKEILPNEVSGFDPANLVAPACRTTRYNNISCYKEPTTQPEESHMSNIDVAMCQTVRETTETLCPPTCCSLLPVRCVPPSGEVGWDVAGRASSLERMREVGVTPILDVKSLRNRLIQPNVLIAIELRIIVGGRRFGRVPGATMVCGKVRGWLN
jgi:hypothetical protein